MPPTYFCQRSSGSSTHWPSTMYLYATSPGCSCTCAVKAPLASGPVIASPGLAKVFQSPVTLTTFGVVPLGGT